MTDELNKTQKPTTDQRRAMAQLAEGIFAKGIQEARDEEGGLVEEITGDLRKRSSVLMGWITRSTPWKTRSRF